MKNPQTNKLWKVLKNFKNKKNKTFIIIVVFLVLLPNLATALEMPPNYEASSIKVTNEPDEIGITAFSYLVVDRDTDEVLMEKNSKVLWTPASLTKLLSVMVLLDLNPVLEKKVVMKKEDEVGGVRIRSGSGIAFRFIDLLHASLIPSANNAMYALARSTGWSERKFVEKMNQKALELGATSSFFVEPTGLSSRNKTTAEDYAKIVKAAFTYPLIQEIASKNTFSFGALNSTRYWQKVKTTNDILNDSSFNSLLGKTGYLKVSKYNFASIIKDKFNNDLIVVILGSKNKESRFTETKQLAMLGGLAKVFPGTPMVLGASTQIYQAFKNLLK